MNESIRTLVFVTVAAVAALAAFASRPVIEVRGTGPALNTPLFPNFKDPLEAKTLEIKEFDEAQARAKTFSVAQQPSGRWVVPSHGNYPANAESQLKAVAETLADLKIVWVMNENSTNPAAEHSRFGVLDPEKAEVGTAGVGTLITVQDAKGNDLVKLIVGKEDADKKELRFVRKPTEDLVYVTAIDLSKLPTDFDKWIEKDLLKLSTFDVAKVTLKDYLILPTQGGRMALMPRMDATLSYDGSKGEWKTEEMFTYSRGQQKQSSPPGDMEELNKQKLDDLRNALGDLKIVDVVRKPEGLGNSLAVSSDKLPQDQIQELQDFGFYPHPSADGTLDIYGKNGEVIVDTKDGVEYILRFGDLAASTTSSSTTKKDSKSKSGAEEDQVKVNRYLFVTTRAASSILTPPQLEPEPAGPEPAKEEKPADAEKKDEAAKSSDQKDETKPPVVDPQQAERERVKKENQRKLDEYRNKKQKADTRVAELNARFANWYYVVSEDVYKKIRLVRSDIVKEAATAKDEGFGIDAFRKLEEEGLKAATPGEKK